MNDSPDNPRRGADQVSLGLDAESARLLRRVRPRVNLLLAAEHRPPSAERSGPRASLRIETPRSLRTSPHRRADCRSPPSHLPHHLSRWPTALPPSGASRSHRAHRGEPVMFSPTQMVSEPVSVEMEANRRLVRAMRTPFPTAVNAIPSTVRLIIPCRRGRPC